MNRKKTLLLLTALGFVLTAAVAGTETKPATKAATPAGAPGEITFKANNEMYSADGTFTDWSFTNIDIPGGDITKGVVEMEIDLASVAEKSEKLAAHLRTPDFFDVKRFTTATVKIHGAKKKEEAEGYTATATVGLHGMSSDVPVEFTVTSKKPLAISGTAVLVRTAHGIGGPYEPGNGRSITDDISITLDATLK